MQIWDCDAHLFTAIECANDVLLRELTANAVDTSLVFTFCLVFFR